MPALLFQAFAPGDCILTGLCTAPQAPSGPPAGFLFLALGVVLAGGYGFLRARRRAAHPPTAGL